MDNSEVNGKTSSDIIAELFSTFDVEPPVIAEGEAKESSRKEHKSKKSKKSKKKHKKHKRKRRTSKSDTETSSDESKSKRKKLEVNDENFSEIQSSLPQPVVEQVLEEEASKSDSNGSKKHDDCASSADKKSKIVISSLAESVVLKEAKEKKIEEEERKLKLEDGELSDCPSENNKNEEGPDVEIRESGRKRRHARIEILPKNEERYRSSKYERSPKRSRDMKTNYHRPVERERDRERERFRQRTSHNRSEMNREERERPRRRMLTPEIFKHRRRSPEKKPKDPDKIDKRKLLEIARKNAKKLISAGIVTNGKMVSITSGGKTVSELTEYCKKISKREALGDEFSEVESGSSDDDRMFHHPFQVKDRPNSIVMNIKNAVALPVSKSLREKALEQSKQLTLQFPVSSGSTHRLTENEWVAVEPKSTTPLAIEAPPPPPVAQPPLPKATMTPRAVVAPLSYSHAAIPPPAHPIVPVIQPTVTDDIINPAGLDINDIVTKRLDALRKLQENPKDRIAKHQVSRTQTQVDRWMREKRIREPRVETGEFTGSTGARVLTVAELGSGQQAWAKRDQLISATPVRSGMGMALLQKMGWQPGEGLGKHKEGTLEPLKLEVKTDKKGLLATDESWKGKTVGLALPTVKTLDGKHPVSLLNEYCTRRRWGAPIFELAFECGPDHQKTFLFKVRVNKIDYQPTVASVNKKQAKAEAAAIALRSLGLISGPTEAEIAAGVA